MGVQDLDQMLDPSPGALETPPAQVSFLGQQVSTRITTAILSQIGSQKSSF